ncbi:hypothetical protein PAPYR_6200 [Paratrimastix pyriformis]|uniref:BRCT domain-containing protein n=1 Tax=Paratrimastix pyriformis TaxID=342808 RepID=A0ABQ8UKT3_9EUKA|nr:hypothetical protein PAPYR_6200 [Paratrimastix pyriformis]
MERDRVIELIRQNGGTVTDTVDRDTTHLIAEARSEKKWKAATDLNVPILKMGWLQKALQENLTPPLMEWRRTLPGSPDLRQEASETEELTGQQKRPMDELMETKAPPAAIGRSAVKGKKKHKTSSHHWTQKKRNPKAPAPVEKMTKHPREESAPAPAPTGAGIGS